AGRQNLGRRGLIVGESHLRAEVPRQEDEAHHPSFSPHDFPPLEWLIISNLEMRIHLSLRHQLMVFQKSRTSPCEKSWTPHLPRQCDHGNWAMKLLFVLSDSSTKFMGSTWKMSCWRCRTPSR